MAGQVYYNVGNVRVTNALFVVGDETYPLGQITSVKVSKEQPKTGCVTWLLILGVLGAAVGAISIVVALSGTGDLESGIGLLLGFGVVAFLGYVGKKSAKPTYYVQVTTAAGEKRVLSSHNRGGPQAVVDALSEALADRG